MLCYAMLCYAMLCRACYAMPCYAMPCHAMLCYAMLLSSQQSRSSLMLCRYRRLYNAAIKDRAVTYAWFFLMYLIHIAFCIWSAVSPPLPGANDWSHTGFIACIKAFHASKFVGVVYTIGGVFWALESLWSLWVLKSVCSTVDMVVAVHTHCQVTHMVSANTAGTCSGPRLSRTAWDEV